MGILYKLFEYLCPCILCWEYQVGEQEDLKEDSNQLDEAMVPVVLPPGAEDPDHVRSVA